MRKLEPQILILLIFLMSCKTQTDHSTEVNKSLETKQNVPAISKITQRSFGKTTDNQEATLYTLKEYKRH